MEFLFKRELHKEALFQGDLLARTPVLQHALAQAHSYYAEAPDYSHFMVLTQSCDLVRRGSRPPKSRYITLAACRPLSVALKRTKATQGEKIDGLPIPILAASNRVLAEQLLERFLHNTEDGYFFIRRDSAPGVTDNLCAFLPLSVALRIDAHYDACAAAKVAELEDIFAAKLGWMTGNLYSRIGTPDLEEKVEDPATYKKDFITEFLADEGMWLTNLQIRWVSEEVRKWHKANKGISLDEESAREILQSVPRSEQILADTIVSTLLRGKALDDKSVERARNLLSSNSNLRRIAASS